MRPISLLLVFLTQSFFSKAQPSATISGGGIVCQNGVSPSVTFTGTNGTPPYLFTYKINGGADQIVSSNTSSIATVLASTAISGPFNYTLVSVSSSTGSQNQTGSAYVNINQNPTVLVNSTTICPATLGTITATPGFVSAYSYSWTVLPVGVTNPGNVASFTSGIDGEYGVIITNVITGCVSEIGIGTITYVNTPSATISGTLTVCQNSNSPIILFTGSSASSPYQFVYNINGNANQSIMSNTSGIAEISAPTNVIGSFVYNLVSVTSSDGCWGNSTGQATINIQNCASINEITEIRNKIYPNPTQSFLTIECVEPANKIFIYNLEGQLIKSISPEKAVETIDLNELKNGIYLISVDSNLGVSTERLIIEKYDKYK